MFELNLNKAASIVCRNPVHVPQAVSLLSKSLPKDGSVSMSVDAIVNHWWDRQLFLNIKLS